MNNKNIKELHIVFENCEELILNKSEIVLLSFNNIYRTLSFSNNNIQENQTCGCVVMWLNINKNKKLDLYGHEKSALERLQSYNDITQIHIYFDDKTSEWFFVEWHDGNEYNNNYQTTEFIDKRDELNDANIEISIGEHNHLIKD